MDDSTDWKRASTTSAAMVAPGLSLTAPPSNCTKRIAEANNSRPSINIAAERSCKAPDPVTITVRKERLIRKMLATRKSRIAFINRRVPNTELPPSAIKLKTATSARAAVTITASKTNHLSLTNSHGSLRRLGKKWAKYTMRITNSTTKKATNPKSTKFDLPWSLTRLSVTTACQTPLAKMTSIEKASKPGLPTINKITFLVLAPCNRASNRLSTSSSSMSFWVWAVNCLCNSSSFSSASVFSFSSGFSCIFHIRNTSSRRLSGLPSSLCLVSSPRKMYRNQRSPSKQNSGGVPESDVPPSNRSAGLPTGLVANEPSGEANASILFSVDTIARESSSSGRATW
mmetsp:Transcript_9518/g.21347  ORF Transcript_9518/g.21347 Transcript_9518/m.21347 type:complete len:343 (+) Transcript_9518:1013-2041(+)